MSLALTTGAMACLIFGWRSSPSGHLTADEFSGTVIIVDPASCSVRESLALEIEEVGRSSHLNFEPIVLLEPSSSEQDRERILGAFGFASSTRTMPRSEARRVLGMQPGAVTLATVRQGKHLPSSIYITSGDQLIADLNSWGTK